MSKLIGEKIIKSERYFQSESGFHEDTVVCGFGDSESGLVEQDIRKYVYENNERILTELIQIHKELPCENNKGT
jgi:hypothetical protein